MADNKMLETDSLDILIKAVQDYQSELDTNRQILINAANICDEAMGNDEISRKHITQLNEALKELEKTSMIVSNVADTLIRDRKIALDTLDD